ncbi:MAG: hypothetical protein QOF11_1298 [Chloroflexota bacterium]|jgi:hypothetical protein|nr:hypothetical protein [Chloroflexota bacterium]
MAGMTGPTDTGAGEPRPTDTGPTEPNGSRDFAGSGPIPGETGPPLGQRRLERAPGAWRGTGPPAGTTVTTGSPMRAIALGIVGAIVGVAAFLVLGIVFSFSAGLVVAAVFAGRFIALFVRAGAAGSLSAPARSLVSVVIFLVALSAAILTIWLVAGLEGGDLPLGEYLVQAYGVPIVALEFMLGTLTAWWSAR